MKENTFEKYLAKPNKTIKQHNDELLERAKILLDFDYISKETNDNLCRSILYHDSGKANEECQKRITSPVKIKMDRTKEIPHNFLSCFFVDKNSMTEEQYLMTINSILNHHHFYDNNYRELQNILSDEKELVNALLSKHNIYSIKRRDIVNMLNNTSKPHYILNTGLLMKCDHAASAGLPVEFKNDFMLDGLDKFLKELQKKNPNVKWNEAQQFAIDNRNNCIMLVASTGMGKTESALAYAGNSKLFYALPIKSSATAIAKRIEDNICNNKKIEERVGLLHSDSYSYYIDDDNISNIDEHYNKTKMFSMPVTVASIDQLFKIALRYPGYELIMANLCMDKSTTIIDEIQLLDSKSMANLVYGIKMIRENSNARVGIITATMPGFLKDIIFSETGNYSYGKFFLNKDRHNIKTIDDFMSPENVRDEINKVKHRTNKFLVIANTVRECQEMTKYLKKEFPDIKVKALHSKFIRKDRLKLESEILKDGDTYNNKPVIWVTTNIVEASLDIDFDYLITSLKDLSSFYQRLGRVNRKGVKNIDNENCTVFLKLNKFLQTKITDKTFYNLSYNYLLGFKGIISEKEKIESIDTVFSFENVKDSDYYKSFKEQMKYLNNLNTYEVKRNDDKFRDIESYTVMPVDVKNKYNDEINDILNNLKSAGSKEERYKLKNKLLDYTLPYQKAKWMNNFYNNYLYDIEISKKEKILVISSVYDDVGMSFNTEIFI